MARAVDGELISLRGEPLAGLGYPGAAVGLPGVWQRIEAEAAAVLGGATLASLLPADALAGAAGRPPRDGAA